MKIIPEDNIGGEAKRPMRKPERATGSLNDAASRTRRSAIVRPRIQPRFLVSTYANRKLTEKVMTEGQLAAMDIDGVDLHWEEDGLISIRRQVGKRLSYLGVLPGVGPDVGIPFLHELMWLPGRFRRHQDLANLAGLKSFSDSNAMSARLTKLRHAFGETDRKPWYFIRRSRPLRVCWHPDRSWRFIEILAEPETGIMAA